MTTNSKQIRLILVIIVGIAFLLRLIGLSHSPPSLNWDEVSHGYNAYSILRSGRDEWGMFFPLIFRAYGDYKLPIYIYLTSIAEALLGLNIYSVRMVSVLAGTLSVLFTYLLTRELFKKVNKNFEVISLIAAILVAIEPWSLFLSRGAFEANLAQMFIIAGFWFLFKNKKRSVIYQLAGLTILGLSVWTYNSARVFVPLLLGAYFFIFKKSKLHKPYKNKILYLPLIFLFVPMFIQLLMPTGQARFSWVSFVNESFINDIISARNNSELSPSLTRLVHNRYSYFVPFFARNYLSHFSPNFIFINGGSHYQFGIPATGLIYPVQIIFVVLGFVYLLNKRKKQSMFILSWILLAPIASSLTVDTPHALRFNVILPIPMILTAVGFVIFVDFIQKKFYKAVIIVSYIVVLFYLFLSYQKKLFYDYPKQYSWAFQYGHEQMVDYLKSIYDNYDYIIVTKEYGEPHEFILFYWPWEPQNYYNNNNLIRFYQSNWYWVDGFDKFYFVNSWDTPVEGDTFILESGKHISCESKKCLLVIGNKSEKVDWVKIKTIDFLDNSPAFRFYENK